MLGGPFDFPQALFVLRFHPTSMSQESSARTVFISYSHDSAAHKAWVLALATRLRGHSVDVVLDQWDLPLGADLPHFMESGLTGAQRVLAVCSEQYVVKANGSTGGVGYEKMILSAQLMRNVLSEHVVPLVRDNVRAELPTFLSGRLFADFRDDGEFDASYFHLLRDLLGVRAQPKPPLGRNPFENDPATIVLPLSQRTERYISPALRGTVTFDYSNNDGRFVIGAGDLAFTTSWTRAGGSSIHTYRGSVSDFVALAVGCGDIAEIDDAGVFDASTRHRTPHVGEIVIWRNSKGFYAAGKVEKVSTRSLGASRDELVFSYVIQANGGASFRE